VIRAFAVIVWILVVPGFALADVAPPNHCDKEGAGCDRAGPKYDQPGVCAMRSCSTATPDGSSRSAPCKQCILAESADAGVAAPRTGKEPPKSSGGSGCEAGAVGAGTGAALVASLGVLGALVVERRRRRAR
jgi:hypothetical protein